MKQEELKKKIQELLVAEPVSSEGDEGWNAALHKVLTIISRSPNENKR